MPITLCPSSINFSTTALPMKPAAPVTKVTIHPGAIDSKFM